VVGTVQRNEVGGLTSRPVGQLFQIPIGKLVEAPWNARTDFGAQAELEASIREEGILNPLIARVRLWDLKADGGDVERDAEQYEVFCGHRRLRAALARIALADGLLMGDNNPVDVAVRRGWVAETDPHQADLEGIFSKKLSLMGTAEVLGLLAELYFLNWQAPGQVASRGGFHPVTITRELLEGLGVDEKAIRAEVEKRVRAEEVAKAAAAAAAVPEEKAKKKPGAKASKGKGRRAA